MNLFRSLLVVIAAMGISSGEEVNTESNAPIQFVMKKHPSIRVGDWLKVDLRAKVQMDFIGAPPEMETEDGLFDPRRLRVGVQGRLLRDLEFELEYELMPADYRLRDAYVNYRRFRQLQFQGGKFKLPFGLDQLTGPTNLDFVYRSRIGSLLTPGRDTGVMLHGEMFEEGLQYQAGMFRHDGENAEAADNVRTGGATLAARITGRPAVFVPAPRMLRTLEVGTAFTHGEVDEGLNSLRGRTVFRETYFSRMYVKGSRMRQGFEATWLLRSLALKSEYIKVREERLEQSLRGEDLPALLSRGWYVSATHPLIGRRKNLAGKGVRSLLPGTNPGLVEFAARYEQLRFGSESTTGTPSRSPRAANVLAASNRAWTLGVNWHATRYTKIQFNAVREFLEDPSRAPVSGTQRYWTFVGRIQFVL